MAHIHPELLNPKPSTTQENPQSLNPKGLETWHPQARTQSLKASQGLGLRVWCLEFRDVPFYANSP